jgi:hypothetical protein
MGLMRKFLRDDRGSISLLVMSLFMVLVITSTLMTNISGVYLAKRALTQGTEAAAQRGVRNLDLESYYSSKYTLSTLIFNVAGFPESDPGIPIDCQKGSQDAVAAMQSWAALGSEVTRENLGDIRIEEMECDGYSLSIKTSASASLPFTIPFTGISTVRITSTVGTFDERKITDNYYGISIP